MTDSLIKTSYLVTYSARDGTKRKTRVQAISLADAKTQTLLQAELGVIPQIKAITEVVPE